MPAAVERTLLLLKPDTVHRGLIGEILSRIERKGLKIIAMKMMALQDSLIEEHYFFHREKPFFPEIVKYMTEGPIVALVVEGDGAIALMRALCGATDCAEAAIGTIRGDYGLTIRYNLIHASDSAETAAVEIPRFFDETEIHPYARKILE